ncbi:MAG: hypothetical protein J6P61_02765 [Erysipelotrichaceae bacterium]|nr:hypothetical protein [Erysipelotrichaceae bacterium]
MRRNNVIVLSPVKRIAAIGILSAVNISSRIVLQFLPNIKPVTALIILSVMLFGLTFGLELTFVTTIVSGMFLGIGPWTIFQIFAWAIICLLTYGLVYLFNSRHRSPPLIFMAVFAAVMGYVFGFFVSFEKLVEGGLGLFIPYYLSGLLFDTYHAVGNFFFYLVCAPVLFRVFEKEIKKYRLML